MNKSEKLVNKYNKILDEIAKQFCTRYYKEIYNEELSEWDYELMDYVWIKTWMVEFCDMYFSIDDILVAELYKIPCKIFEKRYYLRIEEQENINLYNYWRINKENK